MSSARPEPQEGEIFAGKFRIERLLGKGGMGAVYAAQHEGLKQKFAIKVLLGEIADNPEAVARFMNEASSAAVIQTEDITPSDGDVRAQSGVSAGRAPGQASGVRGTRSRGEALTGAYAEPPVRNRRLCQESRRGGRISTSCSFSLTRRSRALS